MENSATEKIEKLREKFVAHVEEILSYTFSDPSLLARALTHPSSVEEKRDTESYERLEFLGDAILGAVIALEAYKAYPSADEGRLTRIKVALVSGENLSRIASELGLQDYIVLGKSERQSNSRGLEAALENVLEAIFGALYLDGGIAVASRFIKNLFANQIKNVDLSELKDPKSRLQELVQKEFGETPVYRMLQRGGPAHTPTFVFEVLIGEKIIAQGEGTSKKKAERAAAEKALQELKTR